MAGSLLAAFPRLAVVDVPGAGRGVVAACELQPGELLASCAPYAVALEPAAAPHICLHCGRFAKRQLPVSCKRCSGAFFCSPACATAGRQRHDPVCGYEREFLQTLRRLDAAAESPLHLEPFEETTCRLMLGILLTHAAAESDDGGAARLLERGAPTYASVLAQAALPDGALPPRTAAIAELAHAALVAVLPAELLPRCFISSDTRGELLSLFARDEANGFALWSPGYERRGVLAAPSAALFNHSCVPNAAKLQAGLRVEVRALRAISAGEELRFCYVPLTETGRGRREILQTHFGFACDCPRCAAEAVPGVRVTLPACAHSCGGALVPSRSHGVLKQPCRRCSICDAEAPA